MVKLWFSSCCNSPAKQGAIFLGLFYMAWLWLVYINTVWLNRLVKLELIPELSINLYPFLTLLNIICKDSGPPLWSVGKKFSMGCQVNTCALVCQGQPFTPVKNKTAGKGAELGEFKPLTKCSSWYPYVLPFPVSCSAWNLLFTLFTCSLCHLPVTEMCVAF